MTTNFQSPSVRDGLRARTTLALRIVLAVSLLAAGVMALAQSRPACDLGQLEIQFWACDYAAATYGVSGPDGVACGIATEALKQCKFEGDFEAMLAWWSERKPAMHRQLAQEELSAALADSPPPP